MKTNQSLKIKLPEITIDNSLGKYREMDLFKEKVARANHILKTVGLPNPDLINKSNSSSI